MSNLQRINKEYINWVGYANRKDLTNMNDRYITAGSKNVLVENIDDQTTRIMTRAGVTPCSTVTFNADVRYAGSYNITIDNVQRYFFTYVDKNTVNNTTYMYESREDVCTPVNIGSFSSTSQFTTDMVRFTRFKDYLTQKQVMLFANGTNNIYSYNGSSIPTNTLNPMLYGNGTGNYPATSTGVTVPIGSSPFPPKLDYTVDYIKSYKNQLLIGSKNSPYIYMSTVSDWKDFNYGLTDRLKGEGAYFTLDANCRGFADDETSLKIFADNNYTYEVVFTEFTGNRENVTLKPLKISNGQGAIEQELITNIKNGIIYVSKERTVDILSEAESFTSVRSTPINDIVQVDFDCFNYKYANLFYHKRHVYFMFPEDSTIMIYSLEHGNWQAPQIMGVNIAGMIAKDDILYGYEYVTDDNNGIRTYRLDCFNNKTCTEYSLNDDGVAIEARIVFPYTHLGYRHHQKFDNNLFIEGYISANSQIETSVLYDYYGSKDIKRDVIYGYKQLDDKRKRYLYEPKDDVSLGNTYLGSHNMSNNSPFILPKFRVVQTHLAINHYERQIQLYGNEYDQEWGILSISTNAGIASDTNFAITK